MTLDSPESFDAFKQALLQNPMLKVDVQRETEYYEGQSKGISTLLGIVANTVGAIMAVGALFGALNTMYSAVSARTVEIATLRAVGFGSWPVVASVLIEAQVLALSGALVGGAIAWIVFNGSTFSTGGTLGQVTLRLHVGAPLIALGHRVGGCDRLHRRIVSGDSRSAHVGRGCFARGLTRQRLTSNGANRHLHRIDVWRDADDIVGTSRG